MKAVGLFPPFVFLVSLLIIKNTSDQADSGGFCHSFGTGSVSVPLVPAHPFLVISSL